ncbi:MULTISPECIES: carbohydrate kinase family protein [Bacillaceae]|uniref:carbohydrate kinase family protein n=1 Tax=Bacillaceae TaxID=186817 RepID=UPI000C771F7A|nr:MULTISPECIES: carbohydrate kinase [Bacillaceae]PLR67536.1 carbohydrate kinase [Bacillus sp. UMB0893]QNG59829.1 carbohydrate kinase [Bacillus sp. PAMC26568]
MSSSVICIGELLIDFFCTDLDIDLVDGKNFEKQAGGAPANVCAAIVKLGGSAAFCGKVGDDPFGHFLRKTLEGLNVDTSTIVLDKEHPTTLAFVSLKGNGERDFVFNRGADAFLSEEELDKDKLKQFNMLHFGSATALLDDPFQSAYLNAMRTAKEAGKFISFDPNFRKDLWAGRNQTFVDLVKKGMSLSDFVKVSDDELKIITGMNDVTKGVSSLHEMGVRAVAVTLGKKGTFVSNGQNQDIVKSIKVHSIDSTGAGDAFVGAMLFQLGKEEDPRRVLSDFEYLKKITFFSNKVGAMVCTKVGAISAIPNLFEAVAAE